MSSLSSSPEEIAARLRQIAAGMNNLADGAAIESYAKELERKAMADRDRAARSSEQQ